MKCPPSVRPSMLLSVRPSVRPSVRASVTLLFHQYAPHHCTNQHKIVHACSLGCHFLILEYNPDLDPDPDPQITLCFRHAFVSSIGDTPLHQSTPHLASRFIGTSKGHLLILEHNPDAHPDPDPQITLCFCHTFVSSLMFINK